MDKQISKNSLINLISRVWSFLSVFIFIPLYIRFLGEEAYGLVSFFATMQAVIQILGLGLSNSLKREFAKSDDILQQSEKYSLYKSVEFIYILLTIIFIAVILGSSNLIAKKWLNLDMLQDNIVSITLVLMSISISIQFISNIPYGCLLGQNRHFSSNILLLLWSLLKGITSIIVIAFIINDIRVFYIVAILFDFIYLLLLRFSLFKHFEKNSKIWNLSHMKKLKSIWKYAASLFVISTVSVINRQIDKILISKYLSLTELGAYNTLSTLGNLAILFVSAISIASFSTFTNDYTNKNYKKLDENFMRINNFSALIVICMGIFIATFSIDLINIWIKNDIYSHLLNNVAFYVILGTTFLGLQEIPYIYMLSQGKTKYNVILSFVFMPIGILANYYFINKYGLIGVSITYFLLMTTQTIVLLVIVFKVNKVSPISSYILKTYVLPLFVSLLVATVGKITIHKYISNMYLIVLFAVCLGIIALGTLFILLNNDNKLKTFIKEILRK